MKKIQNITLLTIIAALLYSCGASSDLEAKRKELEGAKKELAELNAKIGTLEKEIADLDTTSGSETGSILVSTYTIKPESFIHQIEVRGSVESRKNVMLSAETMGRVERIDVTEGQKVSKGTLLMKLDADILENNVSEVKTQLELAEAVFTRQENLWKQNIGTEIQYLQAKNNKESLERRLATLNSQLSQAYVRAPFTGVVDNIPVKVGEMAQPGMPLLRIVNQQETYVKADVPEAYLGKIKTGDVVEIYFPSQDLRLKSKVMSVGGVINDQNRTFSVEVSIPSSSDSQFRPNQVVVLSLTDYENKEALSVPTKIVQSDESGKYLYAMGSEDGRKVAKKVRVTTGKSFNNKTEILSGLKANQNVIDKGYRDVSEGAEVSLATGSL